MKNGIAAVLAGFSLITLTGCESDAPPAQPSAIRYQADASRDRIWTLTRNGVELQLRAKPGKTTIELPDWAWVDTQWACPPDLAIGPKGEALITSNVVPTLWKVDPETLAVTVHPLLLGSDTQRDFGFSRLVYSRDKGAFIATSDVFPSAWEIDAQLSSARKIAHGAAASNPCGFSQQ
jgi:hypothetical protein